MYRMVKILIQLMALMLFASCRESGQGVPVAREKLFSLGYGSGEMRIEPLSASPDSLSKKLSLFMKDGLIYTGDGRGRRITCYTSFGDPLFMLYDPRGGTSPLFLAPAGDMKFVRENSDSSTLNTSVKDPAGTISPGEDASLVEENRQTDLMGRGRYALPVSLHQPGPLAVDSRQTLSVADRVPSEKRLLDDVDGSILDRIVLRFNRNGESEPWLGQEGPGGTPFPVILDLAVNDADELFVISASVSAFHIHCFDEKGGLIRQLKLDRDALPYPLVAEGLDSTLDRILPDVRRRELIMKFDFYKALQEGSAFLSRSSQQASPEPESASSVMTKGEQKTDAAASGFSSLFPGTYAGSWLARLSLVDGSIMEWIPVPAAETGKKPDRDSIVPALLGISSRGAVYMSVLPDGATRIMVSPLSGGVVRRFDIRIQDVELRQSQFMISREGILCALLAQDYKADIVIWRLDRLTPSR